MDTRLPVAIPIWEEGENNDKINIMYKSDKEEEEGGNIGILSIDSKRNREREWKSPIAGLQAWWEYTSNNSIKREKLSMNQYSITCYLPQYAFLILRLHFKAATIIKKHRTPHFEATTNFMNLLTFRYEMKCRIITNCKRWIALHMAFQSFAMRQMNLLCSTIR